MNKFKLQIIQIKYMYILNLNANISINIKSATICSINIITTYTYDNIINYRVLRNKFSVYTAHTKHIPLMLYGKICLCDILIGIASAQQ